MPDAFRRLCEVYRDGEAIMDGLRKNAESLEITHAYLVSPGCPNRALGEATWDQLAKHRGELLARLRANCVEALAILKGGSNGTGDDRGTGDVGEAGRHERAT